MDDGISTGGQLAHEGGITNVSHHQFNVYAFEVGAASGVGERVQYLHAPAGSYQRACGCGSNEASSSRQQAVSAHR